MNEEIARVILNARDDAVRAVQELRAERDARLAVYRRKIDAAQYTLIKLDRRVATAIRNGHLPATAANHPPLDPEAPAGAEAPEDPTGEDPDPAAGPVPDAIDAAPETAPDTNDPPRPPNPPTARQLRYARDLARKRRIKLPAECRTDFTACSAFISRHS